MKVHIILGGSTLSGRYSHIMTCGYVITKEIWNPEKKNFDTETERFFTYVRPDYMTDPEKTNKLFGKMHYDNYFEKSITESELFENLKKLNQDYKNVKIKVVKGYKDFYDRICANIANTEFTASMDFYADFIKFMSDTPVSIEFVKQYCTEGIMTQSLGIAIPDHMKEDLKNGRNLTFFDSLLLNEDITAKAAERTLPDMNIINSYIEYLNNKININKAVLSANKVKNHKDFVKCIQNLNSDGLEYKED